eukprot:CAMPEP_0206371438 /NCGR_PEP_ID=MMETSP0294-20121207/6479_1 /ASSEMBLY_ACC=CAM_ASM_000327 /TAXON_ID=39354 /ORGANISM="Heterosigma akashiwo, Strain CCMP2393" /LENGTH=844 /DNA_ID=CAMNT_0053818557 /DNA_START=522 /DNA_END=3053 /DNA_ORIENTATION=-
MGMGCEFDHPFPPGAKGGVLPSNTKGRRQDSDHQQNTVYPNSATKLKDGRWAAAPSTQLQILESDAEDSDYQQNTVYPNSATKLKDGRWAAAPPSQLQVLESEAEGWQVVGRGGSYKSEAGLLSKEGELLRGEINHQNGYSKVMAAEDNDSTDSMLLTESRKNDYASMGFKEEMIIRAAEQEDPNNIDGMVELLVKLQAAEETVHETSHESKHDPASIMTHDSSKRSWSNHQSNSSSTHQQKDFNSEVVSRKRDNPVPAGAPSPLPPSPPPDWRAQLRAGHLVDARDADGRWFESVVVEAKRGSKLKIHFKGWNAKWDTYIDANSEDIQPLFTHTPKWRDLLKVGDTLEVCEPREFPNPRWFEGTVLQLDRQGQKVLVQAVAGRVPLKWADLRGEEICAPGTHIKALVGRQRAAPTPSLPVHMRPGFVPTQQCKYFPFGRCQKGASCTFIHDTNNANSKVNSPLGASGRSTRQEMGASQNLTKEGEDTSRQREEEEASKRSSGEESVRLAEAAQKRAKIEALRRKEEEDAAKRRREAEEAARIKAEAAKRRAEQEAARKSAEEAARIEAEVEAEKRRAEKEEARRNAEEAARIEAEAEAARRRRAEKEAERRNAEEAARIEAELQAARAEKEAARTAEQKKTEQKRAQTTAHWQAQAQAEDEASDSVFQKLQQKEGPLLDEYGIESLDDFSELTANDWKDVSLRMKVINFRRLRKHLGLTPELPSYQEGGPKENGAESLKDVMSIRGNEGLGGNRKAETVSKQRSSSSPRKKGMSNSASTQINAKGSVQQQKQEQKQAPAQDSDALGGTGGERPCSICNKDTFLKCRLCKEARFCSRECQVKGW